MTEPWTLSAAEVARRVRARSVSAREVALDALARLEAANPALNAVVEHRPDETLAAADAVDAALARGDDPGPLAGVPFTVKVNADQAGFATTNGLTLQRDLVAGRDSPVVANLRRAGGVPLGRTNAPAFSLRWFTANRLHGATVNPRDPALTPGGSSGGAAAAVAAGIGALAHGTDIAGSVRYPAHACGVHGLRPSLGRVPAFNATGPERGIGAQLMAVSGPIARHVDDLRLALHAMAAPDPRDPWHVPAPLGGPDLPRRAAMAVAPDGMPTAPAVEAGLRDAADRLRDAGWVVEEVALPPLREAADLQLLLWLAELRRAAPLVAREGDAEAAHVFGSLRALHPLPGPEAVEDALTRRAALTRAWHLFLAEWPLVLTPVSGEPPFPDGLDQTDLPRVLAAQLTQMAFPLFGLPALAVTTGFRGSVPVGVQLVGPRFREDVCLDAGAAVAAAALPVFAPPAAAVSA